MRALAWIFCTHWYAPTAERHVTSVSQHRFLCYFSSPCFIFYTDDRRVCTWATPSPSSSPQSWKIAKHFTHSEHSHLAVQKFTRHESPNYFIWPTRFSSYEMGSLYWASIKYYFFFCAHVYTYIHKRHSVHSPTWVEIIRRSSLAGKSRIRQHKHTLKITLQIQYISDYARLYRKQIIRICLIFWYKISLIKSIAINF